MPFFRFNRIIKRSLLGVIVLCCIIYVFKFLVGIIYKGSCNENIEALRTQICSYYYKNKSVGNFCHDLCVTSQMTILECPNYLWHNGKDFVVTVNWKGVNAVLKARNLKETDPFGSEDQDTLDLKHFEQGLRDVLSATFVFKVEKQNARRFSVNDLIPWNSKHLPILSHNRTSLINLWLLAQDNEFILSQILGTSNYTAHSIVFPRILGTCGHFYLVEYANQILDFSYVLPSDSTSFGKPYSQRLDTAIMLIDFLQKFESLETNLQLCDVKFEHFGSFRENETTYLRMIDSDMIYHKETASEAIAAITECSNDRDCDFVDCEGQCLNSQASGSSYSYSYCQMNPDDNNLKRICRNMLFMGSMTLEILGYKMQLGLLRGTPSALDLHLKSIQKVCLKNNFTQEDVSHIYRMLHEMRHQLKTS